MEEKVGWKTCNLEDACEILDNLRKPINSKEREKRIEGKKGSELYPYYGATGQVGFIDGYLTDGEFVLIGEDGAPFFDYSKDIAYMIKGETWVNNHAHILKSYFNNKYLLHYLNQFNFNGYVSGTTRLKLTQSSLRKIPIEVAPLPEQHATVSKIEHLFSELDNGIANLKLVQEQLKVYRQAVLKKAFEGELTKEWREQQVDLPSTERLLAEIKKERESAVKDYGKKVKPIKPLTEDVLAELPELPEEWKWIKIGEALEVFVGSTPSRKETQYWDGDIPWVSSGEVAFCKINSTKECITKLGLEKSSTQIHPIGTVMLGMIGEGKTRGQVAILNINACHNQNTAAIRTGSYYLSEFIYLFFVKNYIETRRIGSGNNQQALNKSIIENISIPFCSLPEQQAIIAEIETLLSVCDKVEQDITDNLEKAEALRQSILKKAFEGKLLNVRELKEVRNAPDWEPAEVLLEKINHNKKTKS